MLKVILDTNILVSALTGTSFPYKIINDFVFEKRVLLCVSEKLLLEYLDVLTRSKFGKTEKFETNANELLIFIMENALYFKPTITLSIIKDEKDNRLLELADVSNADYLITGNTKHFTMTQYKSTKIISPRAY
jgi:putative PIN family toxin of toxin-antitoxin system